MTHFHYFDWLCNWYLPLTWFNCLVYWSLLELYFLTASSLSLVISADYIDYNCISCMKFNFDSLTEFFFWSFLKIFFGGSLTISVLLIPFNFTVWLVDLGVMDKGNWLCRKEPRAGGNLAVLGEPKFPKLFRCSYSMKFIEEDGLLATGAFPKNELNSDSKVIGIVLVRVRWLGIFWFFWIWRCFSGPKGYTLSLLLSFYW